MLIDEVKFIGFFEIFSEEMNNLSVKNGFWDDEESLMTEATHPIDLSENIYNLKNGLMISLMHSELSEALEAFRKGNPMDKKLPEFDNATVELADCVIRIMDFAKRRNLKLGEAIIAKHNYNKSRPYKHGKEF